MFNVQSLISFSANFLFCFSVMLSMPSLQSLICRDLAGVVLRKRDDGTMKTKAGTLGRLAPPWMSFRTV